MRLYRPWWTYWHARDRAAVRLIQFLEGRELYGLVVEQDGKPVYAMSVTEPTGVWAMLSVDEPTTDLWLSVIRTVFGQQMSVNAVRSPDSRAETAIGMVRAFMARTNAVGAHVWVSSFDCKRVALRTVTDACVQLRGRVPETPTVSPAIVAAVDQLIAETTPGGQEHP